MGVAEAQRWQWEVLAIGGEAGVVWGLCCEATRGRFPAPGRRPVRDGVGLAETTTRKKAIKR